MADTNEQILVEVKELKSWLYGKNGFRGDIPEIKESCSALKKDQDCLSTKYNKLNGRLWLLVGILSGSGALGTGLWQLLK